MKECVSGGAAPTSSRLPPAALQQLLAALRDQPEALGARLGGQLDLVPLNEAPVVLAREVADTGRCLYADPPELESEFVTRARMRYLDFKPYLDEQWRISGERLTERLRGVP